MRRFGVILFALFLLPVVALAQVKVEFYSEKDTVDLGERVKASIVVEGQGLSCSDVIFPSPQLFPQDVFVQKVGDCQVEAGKVKQDYLIAVFSLKPKVGPIPVFVKGKEYKTPVLVLKVKEYLPDDVSKVQPRDFAGLFFVPFPWRWFLVVLVLLLIVGFLAVRLWKQRHSEEEEGLRRPYWEIARERLNKLKKSHLIELGEFRQFYYELTEILRYVIQHRFGIPAMEMTNSEFLSALRSLDLDSETKQGIRELIERSGPVKYAKAAASQETCLRDWELVSALVDRIAKENEARDDNSPSHS